MVEQVSPKTFDLGAALSGVGYPSSVVDIYLDEAVAYSITIINEHLDKFSANGDHEAYQAAEKTLDELMEQMKERKYEFHIQAIPARQRRAIEDKVRATEKAPVIGPLGHVIRDSEADELFARLLMQAMVTKIVAPSGATIENPSFEECVEFRENAPDFALRALEDGILAMGERVSKGFETTVKSADFLSKP